MGFLSKAFKKVKPASMARQASGKMGKGLFWKGCFQGCFRV
jgi:hypothetical protein